MESDDRQDDPKKELDETLAALEEALIRATVDREKGCTKGAILYLQAYGELYPSLGPLIELVGPPDNHKAILKRLELEAVKAVLVANLNAATLTLAENRVAYLGAIALAEVTGAESYIGRAHYYFGAVLVFFEESEEAIAHLEKARLQLDPLADHHKWVEATVRLAEAYIATGQSKRALALLQDKELPLLPYPPRTAAFTAAHVDAIMMLAQLLWWRGRFGKARQLLAETRNRIATRDQYLVCTLAHERLQMLHSLGFMRYRRYRRKNRPPLEM